MGDPLTPEILTVMIRQYFCQHLSEEETINALNHLRRVLHEISPFAREPVDCVLWVKSDEVVANDYNPNVMAPGEKKLLKQSPSRMGLHNQSWYRKKKIIIWWWMVIIVSCWEEGPVQKNASGDGFLLPALIRRERGRRPVWPRPSVITGPEESIRLHQCQISFVTCPVWDGRMKELVLSWVWTRMKC